MTKIAIGWKDLSLTMLDIDKKPSQTRVVVAMSGGVDSSVAAGLLVEAGYEVIGMTMQLYDYGQMADKRKGACCAGQDIYDARLAADKLNIPHYVLDYESRFRTSVIDNFVDSYVQGYTPIPCVRCNQTVKFTDLLRAAKELGADALATGHYVQRKRGKHQVELHRAVDLDKDQSFFLFATTQEQLNYVHFPLGHLYKTQTREQARRFGLKIADKPDSQDICFVPQGNYAAVVEKLRPGSLEPGLIRHVDGRILGDHKGTIGYTVGQRRGLGIGGGEVLYVVRIDPTQHEVIVGPKEELACTQIFLKEVNWLGEGGVSDQTIDLMIKIRSSQNPVPASLTLSSRQRAVIALKNPEYGVAPGQACVFYQGSWVLGGGWIEETDTIRRSYPCDSL